jgi:hypothetical protein
VTCRQSWALVGPVVEFVGWPFRPDGVVIFPAWHRARLTEVGLDLRLRLVGGPELDSGSHPSLLTRWVNWGSARGCEVMLTKSSRDRPSVCHVSSGCHRVPAVPASRPVRLRPLVRRSRWPRPVGGIQLRWIESVVDRLSSSGSKLFELSWAHVRVSWSPGRCWSSHAALLGRGGGASPPDRSWAVLSAGDPPGRLKACGPRPLNPWSFQRRGSG